MSRATKKWLTIDQSCTESWEDMAVQKDGRFCASCAASVTDFTRMTDEAVLNHIRKNGMGCGRFRAGQLNRVISTPVDGASNFWVRLTLTFGLLIATFKESAAQEHQSTGLTMELIDATIPQLQCRPEGFKTQPILKPLLPKHWPEPIIMGGMGSRPLPHLFDEEQQRRMPKRTVLANRVRHLYPTLLTRRMILKRFFNFGRDRVNYSLDVNTQAKLQSPAKRVKWFSR